MVGTIWGDEPLFDACVQFYPEASGPSSMLAGFYVNNNVVTEIDADGAQVGAFSLCSVVPSPTPTTTSDVTPTPTPTQTATPTQTFAWYTYTLGSGATPNDACLSYGSSPLTIYGSIEGGVGPNVGEFLYETAGIPLTDAVPDGYYSNGTAWFLVSGGNGEIVSSDPDGCSNLVTPTPTLTPTNTPTTTPSETPAETPTNTPTQTGTPAETPTNTPTTTPTPTITVTPSSFGTYTYKVVMENSSRMLSNEVTLTEDPYILTSGDMFTGTTGSYPLSATEQGSTAIYGTHGAQTLESFLTISFFLNSLNATPLSVELFINGVSFAVSNGSTLAGPTQAGFQFANVSWFSNDVLEFRMF